MPVDDSEIDSLVQKLEAKRIKFREQESEIRRIQSNLISVKTVEKFNAAEPDPKKQRTKEIPIDGRTGLPFNSQSRQKIYDDNILQAKKLAP